MKRGAGLKLVGGLAVLGVLAVGGYALTVQTAFGGMCADERIWSGVSPDGRYVAEVRNRDCGATTAGAMAVSIVERRGFAKAETLVTYESLVAPEVKWVGSTVLKVRPGEDARAFGPRPTKWRDVTVIYQR